MPTESPRPTVEHWWCTPSTLAAVIEAAEKCYDRTGITQSVHLHPAGTSCITGTHRVVPEPN